MKIGIISFAHMHAYGYAIALQQMEDVEVAGIADDDEKRGQDMARQFQTKYYPSIKALLETDIAAVIVTSENVHHPEHVTAAARAGKHVLCEKPLAITTSEAQQMIDVCDENGVILQTAFPVRFHPSVQRAKQMIDHGDLGRILAVKGTNRGTNPGGWFVDPAKSGGGSVMDHTVHVVDLMRWFMQAEVEEVYAEADHLFADVDIDDAGIVTMTFDNGVFATLDCSWSRNPDYPTWGDVTMKIVGSAGTLSVDVFGQSMVAYANKGVHWDPWGDDMDAEMVKDFIKRVQMNQAPFVTGKDGLKTVEVALGAYESSQQQQPISIGHKSTR